jgi:anti-anti-sigma factor
VQLPDRAIPCCSLGPPAGGSGPAENAGRRPLTQLTKIAYRGHPGMGDFRSCPDSPGPSFDGRRRTRKARALVNCGPFCYDKHRLSMARRCDSLDGAKGLVPRRDDRSAIVAPLSSNALDFPVLKDATELVTPRNLVTMLKPAVQVHNENGVMVAEFWDCFRLDPAPVQDLRKKYESHLAAQGKPVLVVDLLGVGFAGSTALGHFVALHRVARQRGGGLIFCNVDPTVLEVFRVSKLEPLFSFVTDRPAALALAASGAIVPADGAAAKDGQPQADTTRPKPPGKAGGEGLLRSSRRRKLS